MKRIRTDMPAGKCGGILPLQTLGQPFQRRTKLPPAGSASHTGQIHFTAKRPLQPRLHMENSVGIEPLHITLHAVRILQPIHHLAIPVRAGKPIVIDKILQKNTDHIDGLIQPYIIYISAHLMSHLSAGPRASAPYLSERTVNWQQSPAMPGFPCFFPTLREPARMWRKPFDPAF